MHPARIASLCTAALALACTRGHPAAPAIAAEQAPFPSLLSAYQATFFARALDVSCAPRAAAQQGCLALVRYRGAMPGFDQSTDGDYGNVAFIRTDGAGKVIWVDTLLRGFDPISAQPGAFVDDDLRVKLLANGDFLVSGTYEGRVFIGRPGGGPKSNQELGPSKNRNLFLIEFHADGSFDNWEDTGNDLELHATAAALLPDTSIVIGGSCQGDVPLDSGSFACGNGTSGYLLTVRYDGSTVSGLAFGGPRPTTVADLVADAEGNLYVSGTFEKRLVFNDLAPDLAAGEEDGFLMKLRPDRSRAWMVTAASLGKDRGGRLALVDGGVLWTASVAAGARVGKQLFREAGQVVALVTSAGDVSWAEQVAGAAGPGPLRVAAADDGSFALYGDGLLRRFRSDGKALWSHSGGEVRGAAFSQDALVVAATAVGGFALDASVAAVDDDFVRGVVAAFPR